MVSNGLLSSVVDPRHFGTDPDPDPDPRIRTADLRIRVRILLFSNDLQDANNK
jgi:hypothetical protein